MKKVFETDKRIRLGIWGLGRGMSFYKTCNYLNIDVVAGCDYNEHMRANFLKENPNAFVTADEKEFLNQDFDAVLLATFCTNHAGDAIKCLKAGKHVLSEVTAFHTMAEGVRLFEEVERTGLVYNLAENYPFSAPNSYLARKWKEGLFGELLYAEYEYVHDCRILQFTYIDGKPVEPGNNVHSWRSWLNRHYYCTHSLGPMMVITGLRPVQVVSLQSSVTAPGMIFKGHDYEKYVMSMAPSIIRMSNGAVVRNLMGETSNDTHVQRIWGTLGSAEINVGKGMTLRLGGTGMSPKLEVIPNWDSLTPEGVLGELAASTGHEGGDFWVLYYFARQIFTGEKAPFDVYSASDVTIPGILALRSAVENGKAYDVPNFRDKSQRDKWRDDDWAQPRYDVKNGVFPVDADFEITKQFSRIASDLYKFSAICRAYEEWKKVQNDVTDREELKKMLKNVTSSFSEITETYRTARKIADSYPDSDGGRVLREMLEIGYEEKIVSSEYKSALEQELVLLEEQFPDDPLELTNAYLSKVMQKPKDICKARKPGKKIVFEDKARYIVSDGFIDARTAHKEKEDGMVYVKGKIEMTAGGKGELLYGADGPVKVWVNGKAVDCRPDATNPITADEYKVGVVWKKGENEIVFAMDTKRGRAWGMCARAVSERFPLREIPAGYRQFGGKWGENAQLAWDTIDRKPTKGIPSWMLNVMEWSVLEDIGGNPRGSYEKEPERVYLEFQKTFGSCYIDQWIPTNPLSMKTGGYEPGTHRTATTGLEKIEHDGIVIDSPEAVIEHLEKFVFPQIVASIKVIEEKEEETIRTLIGREVVVQKYLGINILKGPYSGFQAMPGFAYGTYGYANYFMAYALYPEVMEKYFKLQADAAEKANKISARAIIEGGLLRLKRLDHDMADSRGTLVDEKTLDKIWFPHFARAIKPFLDAGIKLIWHCDGNLMKMVPRLLEVGLCGFQGFQYEAGMDYEKICQMKTRDGDDLIIIAGSSVTKTLPYGTKDDVVKELKWLVEKGPKTGLILGASSSIAPNTNPENIKTLVEGLKYYRLHGRG